MPALTLVLKLTKLCNMRCSYCFEFEHLADRRRMGPEHLGRAFGILADYAAGAPGIDRVTVVLHGGEPLLLPTPYLLGVVQAARAAFGARGLPVAATAQTNLLRHDRAQLLALRDAGVGLGVSFDVVGNARVSAAGAQTMERVAANIARARADGVALGGIAVLNRETIPHLDRIHAWYVAQGLDFRALPILSWGEAQGSRHGLGITPAERLESLRRLMDLHVASGSAIRVEPIDRYRHAAIRHLTGRRDRAFDPRTQGEWALVLDTDGTLYTYGDSYLPEGRIGNLFAPDAGAQMFRGAAYRAAAARRAARLAPCSDCSYLGACDQIAQAEAAPSERLTDAQGRARCAVDRALIDHALAQLRAAPAALLLLTMSAGQGERALAELPLPAPA